MHVCALSLATAPTLSSRHRLMRGAEELSKVTSYLTGPLEGLWRASLSELGYLIPSLLRPSEARPTTPLARQGTPPPPPLPFSLHSLPFFLPTSPSSPSLSF